ncbi:hypothetical protein Tco_1244229 [Tanacetum coccineum]
MRKKSSQREIRPIWNNVQRVNHQNQFVPTAVLTRTGKIPVNTARHTARASSTNNVSTARHKLNRKTVPSNGARNVNTVKPIMNNAKVNTIKPMVSTFRKPLNRTTALRTDFSYQKVNTAEDYPHRALKNKGIVDSGCSRHMIGNKAYLAEYHVFNGGPVSFRGSKSYITGKGAAKASSTNIFYYTASTPVSNVSPYGGLSFTDLTNTDQDDSEIPALEEIYDNPTDGIFTNSSYDDEGAVADFTNLEPVVNVSPNPYITAKTQFILQL